MTINTLISVLEALKAEHGGDVAVMILPEVGGRKDVTDVVTVTRRDGDIALAIRG